MEVYKDIIPVNTNITIDYTKDKKVSFSYPIKKTYEEAMNSIGIMTFCTFFFIFLIYFWWGIIGFMLLLVLLMAISHFILLDIANSFFGDVITTLGTTSLYISLMWIIIGILLWYIKKNDKNFMNTYLPLIGYYSHLINGELKYKKYLSKDVFENKFIIISKFNNAFLKYRATKDFSKYLQKVEIKNFPEEWIRIDIFGRKKEVNETAFQTTFIFSKKPLKGYLSCYWA